MKKLTAGIFTVMLGLVAADANAAITSKAYVEARVGAVNTKVEALETNKADKATTYTKTEVDTKLGDKQDNLTQDANGSEHILIENGKISATGLTTSTEFNTLSGRVDTAEGKINTLEGTVDGLTSGSGSVANQIADALKPYTNTVDMNKAIADATNDMETKTNAAATYATKGQLTAEEEARAQADSAINTKIGTLPEGMTDVVAGIADAKKAGTDAFAELNTYKGTNDAAVQKNASDITALDTAYKAADTAIKDKIGTVDNGKTVVQMIKDVETTAGSNLSGLTEKVNQNTANIATKQEALTELQLNAVNSGITAAKVTALNALTVKGDIPAVCDGVNATNGCTLVYKGTGFEWEVIEREGGQ